MKTLVTLVALTTGIVAQGTIFSDDFNSGSFSPNWVTYQASVTGGRAVLPSPGSLIRTGSSSWTDYRCSFDWIPETGTSEVRAGFRVAGPLHQSRGLGGYELRLLGNFPTAPNVQLRQNIHTGSGLASVTLQSTSVTFQHNVPNRIIIEVVGPQVRVFAGGALLLTHAPVACLNPSGGIYFWRPANVGNFAIDNVLVAEDCASPRVSVVRSLFHAHVRMCSTAPAGTVVYILIDTSLIPTSLGIFGSTQVTFGPSSFLQVVQTDLTGEIDAPIPLSMLPGVAPHYCEVFVLDPSAPLGLARSNFFAF